MPASSCDEVFDHKAVYEVDSRRLTGRQIVESALHGELDSRKEELEPTGEKADFLPYRDSEAETGDTEDSRDTES